MGVLFLALALLAGCDRERGAAEPLSFSGTTMGTTYAVKVPSLPDGLSLERLRESVEARLEAIHQMMSTWREDSELSRFNRSRETEWFPVSPDTARVLAAAVEVSRQTDGAFDVTVGPLVEMWGFRQKPDERVFPDEAAIARVRESIGYEKLVVRHDPPALKKLEPRVQVDVSAIAKGFGVDAVSRVLDDQGVDDYLVEIGGEVRLRGTKADRRPWTVGVERPAPGARRVQKRIAIRDASVATSGDYRIFFEHGGRRYSHILDPRTGRPVDHDLVSVTVIAGECMDADALATALLVLGPDVGYRFALRQDLAALLILRDGEGFTERTTPAFERAVETGRTP